MPSPASVTRPTSSREAVRARRTETKLSSASRISSGRIVSSVIVCSPQFGPRGLCTVGVASVGGAARRASSGGRLSRRAAAGLVEPAQDGAVDDLVADLDPDAAETSGSTIDLELTPAGRRCAASGRASRRSLRRRSSGTAAVTTAIELLAARPRPARGTLERPRSKRRPRGACDRLRGEPHGLGATLPASSRPTQRSAVSDRRRPRSASASRSAGLAGDDPPEAEQLVLDLVELAGRARPRRARPRRRAARRVSLRSRGGDQRCGGQLGDEVQRGLRRPCRRTAARPGPARSAPAAAGRSGPAQRGAASTSSR